MAFVPGLFNSILVRIMGLTFALLSLSLVSLIAVMQTPLATRVFDRALEESAQRVAELVWLLETSPPEAEGAILYTFASRSQIAIITDGFPPGLAPDPQRRRLLVGTNNAVTERLRPRDIRFGSEGLRGLQRRLQDEAMRPFNSSGALRIAIRLADSRVIEIWIAPSIFFTQRPYGIILLTGLIGVITLVLGFSIHWVVMRPIRELERDAQWVGLAETAIPVSEAGPRELRRLAQALNLIRLRLASLVREREQIMIAIAHDIRTGLTKLRLRIDGHEAVAPEAIEPDLAQMERLLSDMMAYARAENPLAEHELIDLCRFATGLAQAAPYPVMIARDGAPESFTIAGNRTALARLFENLLENARRYGGGSITLRLTGVEQGLAIAIEDEGPGLSPRELEHAFEPFFRGETSRNRGTGGTGLGLGIARAIAHTHGARIELSNRAGSGLCARLVFPDALRT